MENEDEQEDVQLTPKGFFCGMLSIYFAVTDEAANEAWHLFEAFVAKRLMQQDPTATFPCLVFDGEGGSVIGAEVME
jgi:hypothetical protein